MTLVALCSLKGAPGVTTVAPALAAGWPGEADPVIVECDPGGGDLLARYQLQPAPGLVTLAAAARRTPGEPGLVWRHTQELPGGLAVLPGPPGAEQAVAALRELSAVDPSPLTLAAGVEEMVVVADCGRIGAPAPVMDILHAADVMVLLTRATDDALAHLATRLPSAARWSPCPCLVLVGDGYPTAEVSQALGVPVLGRLPHDARGARALSGRLGARPSPARSRLGRASARLAVLVNALAGVEPRKWPTARDAGLAALEQAQERPQLAAPERPALEGAPR